MAKIRDTIVDEKKVNNSKDGKPRNLTMKIRYKIKISKKKKSKNG